LTSGLFGHRDEFDVTGLGGIVKARRKGQSENSPSQGTSDEPEGKAPVLRTDADRAPGAVRAGDGADNAAAAIGDEEPVDLDAVGERRRDLSQLRDSVENSRR